MPSIPKKKLNDEWTAWATKHRESDIKIADSKPFSGARLDAVQEKHDIGPEPMRYIETKE